MIIKHINYVLITEYIKNKNKKKSPATCRSLIRYHSHHGA